MRFDRIASVEIVAPNKPPLKLSNLRIIFDVTKTDKISSNTCSVQIYNLSESTRAKVQEKDVMLRLYAGYTKAEGEMLLFIGDITKVQHQFERPDIITHLECNDGEKTLRETRITISFEEKIDAQVVLEYVAKQLKLTIKEIAKIPNMPYQNGFSFVGPAWQALDKICQKMELEWSIQNNELQILKKGEPNQASKIVISSSTGMLSDPKLLNDMEDKLSKKSKKIGWQVLCNLNPKLEVKGKIELNSRDAKGEFIIATLRHRGDNFEGSWESELEAFEK